MNIFVLSLILAPLSIPHCWSDNMLPPISSCFVSPVLTSISIPSFFLYVIHTHSLSFSILKGQMFPAVTVALHWYSALNLAKSQAAVSASSNHTAIWHRAHTCARTHTDWEKVWRIKGTVKSNREAGKIDRSTVHLYGCPLVRWFAVI